MDTAGTQRFNSLTEQWIEEKTQRYANYRRLYENDLRLDYVRNLLLDAVTYGMLAPALTGYSITTEIDRLKERIRLAEEIIRQKEEQILRFKGQRVNHDAEIDRLLATIERNKVRITALESNHSTEEGRFNIERQYEREFTNTSHLMGEISDLTTLASVQKRKITSLEEEIERLKLQIPKFPIEEDKVREAFFKVGKRWSAELRGNTS